MYNEPSLINQKQVGGIVKQRKIFAAVSATLLGLYGLTPTTASAQNTVYFSTSDVGQTKSIAQWGVEVVDDSSDNMRQSIANMGANNIDVIATNFYVDQPLQSNGQIATSDQSQLNTQLSIAAMAGNKPLIMGPNVGDTDSSYLAGTGQVSTTQWVNVLDATKNYMNSQGWAVSGVMPFNEPDYWSGQGTPQNLHDIMALLQTDPNYQGVSLIGASTLDSDNAQTWYNAISGVATYGSTHVLGGSATSYEDFFQQVTADGGIPSAPEIHELGEAIYAAEYGAQQGIWWGPALLVRGLFVQASQGKQLGYAQNLPNDTAATVYRAPNGNIYAFAGGFERMGASTPYRFVSTSGPVYFNGVGPISQYMIQVGQGGEAYADIQTTDPEPALDGNQWEIVNRQTGQVLQVTGGSTSDGALVNSAANINASYQQWDITRNLDGYYALNNANSGLTLDVVNGTLANNGSVDQWATLNNLIQQWSIQPAGNGYYYIENANSDKVLTSNTTNDVQQSNTGSSLQQWEFVPTNPPVTGTLTTQYKFQGNVNDSAGTNNAVAYGSPTYGNGPTGQGQAINLNGTTNYVQLPSGVANSAGITISALVKWNGGNDWQRIFDFGTGTNSYMFLTPLSGSNTMRFAITNSGASGEQILDTDPIPTGQWIQLAVTISGDTGILYENGEPIVAGQILLNPSDIDSTLNYIGKSQYSADPLFSGMIDDFRIYDYALNQSQMLNLVPRVWTGSLTSNWTAATLSNPKNWQVLSATSTDFGSGDDVLFDDTASNYTVNVTDATVSPSGVQFDNSINNYVLNGPGSVAGTAGLTKGGTAMLTINNANSYSGGTVLSAGTLNINNAAAIGTGTLTIAGGATIDNTSGSAVTLSTNNAQAWNGSFTFGGTNALNMGTGAVTMASSLTVTANGSSALTVGPISQSGGSWQLTKAGIGTLVLNGNNTYTGGTVVTAGRLLIEPTTPTTSALPTGALSISGGTVQLADNVTAGTALATSNVVLTSLSLIGNGALDIGNNRIIIDYSSPATDPIASIETWIKNGFYGLSGPSIISSDIATADAASGHNYGIGYADGADGVVAGLPSGEIEIMFTLLGDANLDGTVNSEDFTLYSHNLGVAGMWDDGDFNYDGTVNAEDFTPFSINLGQSASDAAAAGGLISANGLADVPEPAALSMTAFAVAGTFVRRRRI
jgi:autotransporter-associated beta strand protein